MPRGPLGGPRPLATGSVAILITVQDAIQSPDIMATGLRNRGIEIDSITLDPRVDTYLFNTGLDAVEWGELDDLRQEYEKSIDFANMIQVGESQVGFQ